MTFTFDNSVITPVTTHKHLGIFFSDNGKWTAHIDAITAKVSKQIAVLRKLKYKITREFLSNMYITFIRPTMEYASEVRDNLKLVRTPLNVYFTAFKSIFLSLYAHINSDECHA